MIQQAKPVHPLGFHIWRNRRGWPTHMHRFREAWWIITGHWSLHRAWQRGYDQHIQDDSLRRSRAARVTAGKRAD